MTVLLVAITSFLGWHLQFLVVDFEFEKFFPNNHPDSEAYKKHVEQFGYDNDYLHIIIQRDKGIFDADFLPLAAAFEHSLKSLPDVENIYSPLSLQHVVKSPTGLVIFPLIHTEDPTELQVIQDSVRIFENPFYRSAFSTSGDAISIYMHHAHFADQERSDRLLNAIKENAKTFGISNVLMVGKLSAAGDFISYIQKDFGKFLMGSLLISFLLLLLIFRRFKAALLPFLISLLTLVWVFGLMAMLGYKINLLSVLLPPILFFVSMSDAVHLMNAVSKAKEGSTLEHIKSAVQLVWIPTLLTSITTAIGFLSLIWINTSPVQSLGVFASVGILFAFLITFSLGVVLASSASGTSRKSVIEIPSGWAEKLIQNKWKAIALSSLLLLMSLPGILKLEINSFLLDDLPSNSQVRQNFDYVDTYLGGSKPYEIRVEVTDSSASIWDKVVMDEITKIETYLLEEYPIAKVQSPVTIIKYLQMVQNGGLNAYFGYPEDPDGYAQILKLKNRIDPKRFDKLVTEDGKVARLIGFFPELGSLETTRRNRVLVESLNASIDHSLITYRITGTTYLIDRSHELLSLNLLKGVLTAIAVIAIVLGVYFRSWKLLLVSLIPNIIPLIIVAGVIGWLGISLKMTTSIIFTIVFGIAVDDTIHMMSYYLKIKTTSGLDGLKETLKHAGSAMLITTIIMTSGFILYLFSNFGATFYMGLFVSLSLVVALLVDLVLLPLLLYPLNTND